ncbi:MAG: hypothetical protein LBR77_00585 [Lachnospiraceae bacterium]|nr:hypothetical protein [Lachnospiraceae bacterium]
MNNHKLRSDEVDELFDAVLSLKNREECYAFFEDLATIQEVNALAQRLQIAKRLYHDDGTYQNISSELGVSVSTIGRVKNSLTYGAGGYQTVLDRMKPPGK